MRSAIEPQNQKQKEKKNQKKLFFGLVSY